MSLLKFMPIETKDSTQRLRPSERRSTSPTEDYGGGTSDFSAALDAVRQKRTSLRDAAPAPGKKLDKPESKDSNQQSQAATDKPADNSPPEEASAAQPPKADTPKDDSTQPKATTGEKPETAGPSDNSAATVTVVQANAIVQATATATPEIALKAAPRDASSQIADASKGDTKAGLPLPEPPGQANRAASPPKPQAPAQPAVPASPDAATGDKNLDGNPKPPALSDGNHEKNPRAAHVNVEPVNSPGMEADSPAVAVSASASAVMQSSPASSTAAPAALPEKAVNPLSPDALLGTTPDNLKAQTVDSPHAEAAPAAQDSRTSEVPNPFDQVVLGLKGKLDARNGTAEIRLNPPNLGAVHVSVTLENGTLTAEFQSASNTVRDLLKGNMDKLKSALQGQGVAVDRLAVEAPPASPDAGNAGQNPQASFGSATHDGRSAGQYQQDGRSGQSRSGGEGFARTLSQVQDAPLDLVA